MLGQNRAISDEEDVVLSVFESFYDAAKNGRFPDLSDRDDLWHLLLRMSVRKIVDKHRRDTRQRRGGKANIQSIDLAAENGGSLMEIIGNEPSPDIAMMMEESLTQLFSHLGDGKLCDLAGGKLEGLSNADLAKRFDCSERTIERRLHLIREKCQQELLSNDEYPSKKPADCQP